MEKTEPIDKPDLWVDWYSDDLFRYAVSRGIGKENAEDLVQETFLAAYKNVGQFKQQSQFKTWLFSILRRKVVDFYRKKYKNLEDVSLDAQATFQQDGMLKGFWASEYTPGKWLPDEIPWENEEFQRIFNLCLELLPAKWALVFTLKVIQEYDTEELCKEVQISSSNFWVIMHRARLQLRECMEKNLF